MDTVQLTDGSDIKSVNLHSVVLLSVLDHHIRRKEDQHRVIGTLLGYTKGGVVYVRNCFPVPHTETEQVAVDMNYHRNMFELHQKANSDEEIVGWSFFFFLLFFFFFFPLSSTSQAPLSLSSFFFFFSLLSFLLLFS